MDHTALPGLPVSFTILTLTFGRGKIYINQHFSTAYVDNDKVNDVSERSHMGILK